MDLFPTLDYKLLQGRLIDYLARGREGQRNMEVLKGWLPSCSMHHIILLLERQEEEQPCERSRQARVFCLFLKVVR